MSGAVNIVAMQETTAHYKQSSTLWQPARKTSWKMLLPLQRRACSSFPYSRTLKQCLQRGDSAKLSRLLLTVSQEWAPLSPPAFAASTAMKQRVGNKMSQMAVGNYIPNEDGVMMHRERRLKKAFYAVAAAAEREAAACKAAANRCSIQDLRRLGDYVALE